MQLLLLFLLKIYKYAISPILPCSCRFMPSCSEYSMDAIEKHGLLRGFWLTVKRFCRCHPFAKAGFDPVPEK